MKQEKSTIELSSEKTVSVELTERIIELAMRVSKTVLSCGGETYRADECCKRILYANGADDVEVISFPTALFLTVRYGEETYTRSASISDRSINLRMLDACIGVSRGLTDGTVSPDEAVKILDSHDRKKVATWKLVLLAAASAACFSVVFDGGFAEAVCTLVADLIGMTVFYVLDGMKIQRFISYFISAALIALCARTGAMIVDSIAISAVIVPAITPMLPGLTMTNAVRDSLNGDIVSTSARGVEAIMIAIGIAAGVGVVLMLF